MQTHVRRGSESGPDRSPGQRDRSDAGRSEASRSTAGPGAPLSPEAVLDLQASAGNRAVVQRLNVHRLTVQRAISVEQAEGIARRLEDAMSGLGTDEEAIYGALAGRTAPDMVEIRNAYSRLFSEDLDAELADELNESELARVRAMMAPVADEATLSEGERESAAMDRAAVSATQLHEAMEGLGTEEDQIFNVLMGRTPAEILEIRRQYRTRYDHPLEVDLRDEMSGDELQRALDLLGASAGEFTNEITQHMTEGMTTVVQGRFNWTVIGNRLEVDVPVHFRPAEGVTPPYALWNQQIDDTWNGFEVTEPGGQRVEIQMELRNDSSDSRTIDVVENNVPGTYDHPDRANAGMWYPVMPADTAPHEFGHLIGLPDEYQRTREDFEAITGETRTGPTNTSGKTEADIATELHTALTGADVAQRAPNATTVLQNAGLITAGGTPLQGDFAEDVRLAYDDEHGEGNLFSRLQGLPDGTNWTLMTVFSFASGTIMGNAGVVGTLAHEHPVMPRHLREFANLVRQVYPGPDWTVA
jgi:hypothetical protein